MTFTIEGLLSLPWTILSATVSRDGVDTVELTVEGVAGFMVYGETPEDAEEKFWPAFRMYLQSYLDDAETPPLPAGLKMSVARRLVQQHVVLVPKDDESVFAQQSNTARSPDAVRYPNELAGVG